jgi:hypothetical protein
MAIVGVEQVGKPNKINSLISALPLEFSKGSISVSLNFEQHPTGSISIIHIPETLIDQYRSAYDVIGKPIVLFLETSRPLFFEISNYAETEDAIFVSEALSIKTFDISISLRGGHEKRVNQNYKVKKKQPFSRSTFNLQRSENRTRATSSNFVSTASYTSLYDLSNAFQNNRINLKDFAGLVGVGYEGYSYAVEIPSEASNDYELSFGQVLQEQLRTNGQIVDFTGPIVRTIDYKAGKLWQISKQDIIYSVEFSKQQPYEYQDTVLSGKNGSPFLSKSQERQRTLNQVLGDEQVRKAPNEDVLEEGDETPTQPPLDIKKITTLDLNFDFSGPRKTLKRTKTLNGQPMEEELFTYGFAYLGQDIRNTLAEEADADFDTPPLLTNSPQSYWQLIEYQKTTYIYENSAVSIRISALDREIGQLLPVFYLKNGDQRTSFENRYLTGITTAGWKLARFQQEQYDDFSGEPVDLDSRVIHDTLATSEDELEISYYTAMEKSISFRKIPYLSRTQYRLVPESDYYDDVEAVPFQTQVVTREEYGLEGTGKIVLAIPDPTYIFPMLVLEERTLTQSFDQMDHPQNIIIRDERRSVQANESLSTSEKEEDLKDLKLLPWLTTGEDTYQAILRKIIPSANTSNSKVGKNSEQENDIYVEYEISSSNQDSKFQYSLQEGTFRTSLGRPGSAQVFSYNYESLNPADQDNIDPYNYEYVLSSTNDRFIEGADSLSYETRNLEEGLLAAKADLELNNFLNVYENNINLAWYYPEIRPGDFIQQFDDYSKGKLRVKSVSFQVDFQGHVGDEVLKTCSGTNIVCGRFEEKDVTSQTRDKNTNEGLDISSRISGEDTIGIDLFANMRSRRNPDGVPIDTEAE